MEAREDFRTAIASQPQWMKKTAELATEALKSADIKPWAQNETVVVVGMGSSCNAGAVLTEALRARGVRAVNVGAATVAHYPEGFTLGDHVILVSESGRSPEPIAAALRMGQKPIVITNDPTSPAAELGDIIVPLGGFMDSGVFTIGYITTLVALAAVAEAHGAPVADLGTLAGIAEVALSQFATSLKPVAAELDKATYLDFVGQGTSHGSAQAAALYFRESTGIPTAAHETIEYLHGSMECAGPGAAVLLLGDARERPIAPQLRQVGATVIGFAAHPGEELPDYHRLEIAAPGYASAIAETVFTQCLAADLAELRDRTVGKFQFEHADTKIPE